MDNRLRFLYQLDRDSTRSGSCHWESTGGIGTVRVTDGVTQEARRAQALVVLG